MSSIIHDKKITRASQTGDRNPKKGSKILCQPKLARYAFILEVHSLPKNRLFKLFSVSSSGYYDWFKRRPSQRQLFNKGLDQMITELFFEHKKRYGYRRIYA